LKLLVDENLPPRLAGDLADLFPESVHVNFISLGSTPDRV
jgi:predicted nuclease of predicted toxin-antitoxin system